MTNQEIIDKYLSEFNEVQRMQVPIELNPYLHRMINQALHIHGVVGRSEQLICPCCGSDNTYKTDAIHCNRCAVTTEI